MPLALFPQRPKIKDFRGSALLDLKKDLSFEDVQASINPRKKKSKTLLDVRPIGKEEEAPRGRPKRPVTAKASKLRRNLGKISPESGIPSVSQNTLSRGNDEEIIEEAINNYARLITRLPRPGKKDITAEQVQEAGVPRKILFGPPDPFESIKAAGALETGKFLQRAGRKARAETIQAGRTILGKIGAPEGPIFIENQISDIENFIDHVAPERGLDLQAVRTLYDTRQAQMAEGAGTVLEVLGESLLVVGPVSRGLRSLPAFQKLLKSGRAGIFAARALENVAQVVAVNVEFGITRDLEKSEISKNILENPSALFAYYDKRLIAVGALTDFLASKIAGRSTQEAFINAAMGTAANIGDVKSVKKELDILRVRGVKQGTSKMVDAIRNEAEAIFEYASKNPRDLKGLHKISINAENRLIKLNKEIEKTDLIKEKRLIKKTGPETTGEPKVPREAQPPKKPEKAKRLETPPVERKKEVTGQLNQVRRRLDIERTALEGLGPKPKRVGKTLRPEESATVRQIEELRTQQERLVRTLEQTEQTLRSEIRALKTPIVPRELRVTPLAPLAPREAILGRRKPRKFLQTAVKSDATSKELKTRIKNITPQDYSAESTKAHRAEAGRWIDQVPGEVEKVLFDRDTPPSGFKGALFTEYAKNLDDRQNFTAAERVIEEYDIQLREAGRFIQAAAAWGHLSPKGMVRFFEKEIDKVNKNRSLFSKWFKEPIDLTESDKEFITRSMRKVNRMEGEEKKAEGILKIMDKIGEKIPLTGSEIFDELRYNNMLSSPTSHMRNIWTGLLQAFITRPWNLATEASYDFMARIFTGKSREIYFRDVPRHYRDMANSLTNSVEAYVQVLRGKVDILKPDISPKSRLAAARRRKNVPKIVKVLTAGGIPTKHMEAADRFISAMIAGGEKARLVRAGVNEKAATSQAHKLAEDHLFRGLSHEVSKADPLFAQAIDSIGKHILLPARRAPVIGIPVSIFMPFVSTPLRIAKWGVRTSPLGFIGGNWSRKQLAEATTGSVVTAWGSMLAFNNQTTWAPPQSKEDRKVFYASGRKPYSVQIKDKWVPLWWFGPYALALAMPAAYKWNLDEKGAELSESQAIKIGQAAAYTALSTSRFLFEQTPLTGFNKFIKSIMGDVDYTRPETMAFTASQGIPMSALIRYINKIVDPVYRNPDGFQEALIRDMPHLSKDLEPYRDPRGKPSRRNLWDSFMPWAIGEIDPEFEKLYQRRTKKRLMRKSKKVKKEKAIKARKKKLLKRR